MRHPLRYPALLLMGYVLLSCRSPGSEFGADSIHRFDKGDGSTPTYWAIGKVDFSGQRPDSKGSKVMLAACPNGAPTLISSSAARLPSETSNQDIWMAFFTCNQAIPGIE